MRVPLIVATRVDDFSGGSRHYYFVRLPMIRRHRSCVSTIRVGVGIVVIVSVELS